MKINIKIFFKVQMHLMRSECELFRASLSGNKHLLTFHLSIDKIQHYEQVLDTCGIEINEIKYS